MRVGIVGVGAIGGWVAARLARAGHDVSALARGETLAVLRAGGVTLQEGERRSVFPVAASDRADALGPQDLVVVAVKGPALAAVAEAMIPMLGPQTVVVPAMNGVPWWFFQGLPGALCGTSLASVDPGGRIAAAIPASSVLGCVVHAATRSPSPGHVVHVNGEGLILGEPAGGLSPRLAGAADLFAAAGFEVTQSERIQQDIWYKLWGNMTINPISAITGATADRILDDPQVGGLVLQVMAEAAALGDRIGCPIGQSGEARNAVTRKLGAFKTSMLQDVEAGRPIELDALVAAPREIAGLVGVRTPAIDALLGLTRLFAQVRGLYPGPGPAA